MTRKKNRSQDAEYYNHHLQVWLCKHLLTHIGHGYINFLPRSNLDRLALIQGESDTFGDILGLIADYEGMLNVLKLRPLYLC